MFEDVVVAWNGSGRARGALEWALQRRSTRSALLVRVLPEGDVGIDMEAACRMGLEGEVHALQSRFPDLDISWTLARGDVETVLLSRAEAGRLLVLGTGGFAAVRLPHRTDLLARLARDAQGPVALIPMREQSPRGPVLAGVDGTSAGVAAARIAAAEAVAQETSVVLMHVHGGLRSPDGWPGGAMDLCARELAQHFPHLLVRQRAVHGEAHRELLAAAETASLLVIGRHPVPGAGAALEHDALAGTSAPLLLVREGDMDRAASTAAQRERIAG